MEDRITRNMGAADLVILPGMQPGTVVVAVTMPESNISTFSAEVSVDAAMQLRLDAERQLFRNHADAGVWLARRVRELNRDLTAQAA